MSEYEFKRKIYNEISKWNKDENKVPLIVDGLRQVGKSYIVNKFAHDNYENVITYDFRHSKGLRLIFEGNIDVDSIIRKSAPYFPGVQFIPHKTILIFEEIGDCPLARTSLKSFAMDKRYAVIATGSLLGVLNFRREAKVDVPTGYEKIIHMTSMDFEEFLWANGLSEENIEILKKGVSDFQEIPTALSEYYKEMLRRYVVIGGMPESIKEFLKSNNYLNSRDYLCGLIQDYRADFGRFINKDGVEQIDYRLQSRLNMVFDSIPAQLARETETIKFKYSEIKHGGRSTDFEESFAWLEKSGLAIRCFNLKAIERPLESNADKTYFKAFISDIGLLMATFPLSVTQTFLNDELGSRKGAIFENLLAIFINKSGFPLYYFSNGRDHIEVDFIVEGNDGLLLFEEKSTNGKMAASRAIMEGRTNQRASKCYKIIKENFGEGSFYTSVPQYAVSFLLDNIKRELDKGYRFKQLECPSIR